MSSSSMKDIIKRETENWGRVSGSPHICKLLGFYDDNESVMLVSDLCTGGDLDALITSGVSSKSWDRRVTIPGVIYQILRGIHSCHSKGVIHGDIKPANVLLTTPWRLGISCKITDFGSSYYNENMQGCVYPLKYFCTPVFASPEQQQRRPCLTSAVDMWALGVIAHYLLTDSVEIDPERKFKYMSDDKARSLLRLLLNDDASERIDTKSALSHPWFKESLRFFSPHST